MSELSEGRDASSLCLFCTKKGVYSHKKQNGNKTALAKRTNDFEKLEKTIEINF